MCAIALALFGYGFYLVFQYDKESKAFMSMPSRIKDEIWDTVSKMEPSEAEIQALYESLPMEKRWPNPVHRRRAAVNLWRESKASSMRVKKFKDSGLKVV